MTLHQHICSVFWLILSSGINSQATLQPAPAAGQRSWSTQWSYPQVYSHIIIHIIRLANVHLFHSFSHYLNVYLAIGFSSKTKQWSHFFFVSLWKSWNQDRVQYYASSLPLSPPHTNTHTHKFLHVQSPQGPRWDSLSLRELVLVFTVNPVTLQRSQHYYHIIRGIIGALFGAHAAMRALGLFWKGILFQTEHLFTYNILFQVSPCFSPSPEASWSPVLMPVQQTEWGAVLSKRGKQEGRIAYRLQTQTQQVTGYVSRCIQSRQKNSKLKCKQILGK